MKNTQHQKELFYERMHSIMEQDFAKTKQRSYDPGDFAYYAKNYIGVKELAKKMMDKDKEKKPDRRKKVLDPEFDKMVGGSRPQDPPRLRTYLKKKLIDNPVGNYAKNKEAGRQPTLYQRGVVKAFDARSDIAKRMRRNKTFSDKALRVGAGIKKGGVRTGQWLKRKTGEYLGKERMRALRVAAANRIKSQQRGSI